MALSTLNSGAEYAKEKVAADLQGKTFDFAGAVFRLSLLTGLAFGILILGAVMWDVLGDGTGFLFDRGWDFITGNAKSRSDEYGIFEGLRGTFWIGVFVVVFSFPIGIGAAIYLEEYAPDNRVTRFIELNIRNLAGVPSVVYGVLGLAIFVRALDGFYPSSLDKHLGSTTAAAGATLAILVLPIVIITSAEAIRAVPQALREGGFGVGATKWEVIRHHVLPYAAPGIFTGTLLSLARALGEAAPLILVGGVLGSLGPKSSLFELEQLGERFTAMPLMITQLAKKPAFVGDWNSATAAAILVLLVVVIFANLVAILLRNHFEKKRSN
ncbi:MAG TPA: phosphate ABC transporter permease PtsA [Acidimicrobiaceae bacterium]|jgi:phosphate transport system permease protein|nr:phosphate ABC transporter permease PtsA [Acidimicrobiaceae bacterium]|tara:strand:+ start:1656 stop:2633 length:978 start_codon:yes stop_codon:yes gene_type:complete